MNQAQEQVIDPTTLEFKSLDDWENMWKKGFSNWHMDFVDPYVDTVNDMVH